MRSSSILTTYAYLGCRILAIRDRDEKYSSTRKGEVRAWDAVLETGIVNKPGKRPRITHKVHGRAGNVNRNSPAIARN